MLKLIMPDEQQLDYEWTRQWVPRGGTVARDPEGLVLTPGTPWAKFIPNDAVPIEDLRSRQCLVLLGEPGMGKSRALMDTYEKSRATGDRNQHLFVNLGEFSSEELLLNRIFCSASFKNWESKKKPFWLFLDSFDECLIRIDSVANLLAGQFAALPSIENFHLRIASRPTEWPAGFESDLKKIWRQYDGVAVHELVPLTREQIQAAAKKNKFDAEKFIEAVINREVGPFAEKPLTLDLLFRIWEDQGTFPNSQAEIYRRGCKLLSEEQNEKRDTTKLRPKLTAQVRLEIASRIAVASVLGRKPLIHLSNKTDESADSLSIADLEGDDHFSSKGITITSEMIRESLNTGLFASRDAKHLRWSHPTIADFLAAEYLVAHKLSDAQLSDLLINSVDEKKQIIPQLREIAALIAVQNPGILEKLISEEPDVLLRGDIDSAADSVKARIVESLVSARIGYTPNFDWGALRRRYRKLIYPGLSDQLLKKLKEPAVPEAIRAECIAFARECGCRDMFPEILRIALDAEENIHLREAATSVIARSEDVKLIKELRPLILGTAGPDPHQELKGIAIRASWPGQISAKDLFAALVPPRGHTVSQYFGLFPTFILDGITRDDLSIALSWVANLPVQTHSRDYLIRLALGILEKTLPYSDDEELNDLFARAFLARTRAHDFHGAGPSALSKTLSANISLRHRILEGILDHTNDEHQDVLSLVGWGGVALLDRGDLPWIFDRIESEPSHTKQAVLSSVVLRLFYPSEIDAIERILQLSQRNSIFAEKMKPWLSPVALNSPDAAQGRRFLADQRRCHVIPGFTSFPLLALRGIG